MILGEPKEKFLRSIFIAGLKAQAFRLVGDEEVRQELVGLLIKFLQCQDKTFCKHCAGCQQETNLDTYTYSNSLLKIEEAQEIRNHSSLSSWEGVKIFILRNDFIGPEAQGVLLKTLEEPRSGTYFIISIASETGLRTPLLSRLTVFQARPIRGEADLKTAKKIISGGIQKELAAALYFSKDRSEAEDFFQTLELWLENKFRVAPELELKRLAPFLEDLLKIKSRFYAKTYFNRMLLEHLIISKAYLE